MLICLLLRSLLGCSLRAFFPQGRLEDPRHATAPPKVSISLEASLKNRKMRFCGCASVRGAPRVAFERLPRGPQH